MTTALSLATAKFTAPLKCEWSVNKSLVVNAISDIIKQFSLPLINIVADYLQKPGNIIGEKEWHEWGILVPAAPPLHVNIEYLLQKQCALDHDKSIRDTHTLIYMPATVNSVPLNITNLANALFESAPTLQCEYEEESIKISYWCLVANDTLTSETNFKNLQFISDLPYQMPTPSESCAAFTFIPNQEINCPLTFRKPQSKYQFNGINIRKSTVCRVKFNEKYLDPQTKLTVNFYTSRLNITLAGVTQLSVLPVIRIS